MELFIIHFLLNNSLDLLTELLHFRPCPKSLHQIIQLNPKYVDIFKSYQYTDFKTQLYQVPYSKH